MNAIATKTTREIAKKVQIGTAACAIAAAAALTPLPAAQADPVVPSPLASSPGSLGGSAGGDAVLMAPDCVPVGSPACTTTVAPSVSSSASLLPGGHTIFQNPLWWFGTPNPTPPTQTPVFTFYPLNLIPGFIRPLFSWFADINYEACVFGFTLHIGPYGAVSGSYSRGCA
jgi:hypothetical protein